MFNPAHPTRFSLTLDAPHIDFHVLSFTGTEAINTPYAFEVELVSEKPDLDLQTLLHTQAFLAFDTQGGGIHGQIYRIAQGDSGKRLTRYSLTLVPHLAYLRHRINQRIFQQLSVPRIIALILQEHGIQSNASLFDLSTSYPDREYCVQYDESDLHFIQRLCEEEGIHFHFRHSTEGHTLVFGDEQSVFPKLRRPTAYVQDSGLVADEPVIKGFGVRLAARTCRTARADYDFEKPRVALQANWRGDAEHAEPDLEDYDYPGRFTDRTRGTVLSRRALERHRADYRQAWGRGDQSALVSGHLLTLCGHPRNECNALWLLTQVVHEGKQPQVLEESLGRDNTDNDDDFLQGYRNRFLATPAEVSYRPPLKHPKPRVLGSQTARVTGPQGEEIHCDPYGRVKVQFHWDREGLGDDKSSCWVRVSSSWAGERYGGISIPRVGMEVLVTFLEGDPDQPLVTGCLHHKEHAVPYPLPAHKTRSVFKTLSSPGGSGFNELRIDDKHGAEQIFVHAERDWDEHIERDQTIRVGHERHDTVEKNSYTELKGEEHRTVHADRKIEVRADDHWVVGQNQHIKLGGAQLLQVGHELHLKAGQKIVIEAGVSLSLWAGGSFITLDASGINVSGPMVKLNGVGWPGTGAGSAALLPVIPLPVDTAKAGGRLARAVSQWAPEVIHRLAAVVSPIPGQPGYSNEPYTLFADGVAIQQGLTGADGVIRFEHVPGTQVYEVGLVSGNRFKVNLDADSAAIASANQQLARQGRRHYQAQAEQLKPLGSADEYRSKGENE